MRVLMFLRLYSGFRTSIEKGKWDPTGVPSIYKLINAFEHTGHVLKVVLTSKENTEPEIRDDRCVVLDGLRGKITILAGESRTPPFLGRFRFYLYEARQVLRAVTISRRFSPDIVYVDRGNLWVAGALARWTTLPVVYRILGVSPGLKHAFDGDRPRQVVTRWLLRSPFASVICTQDGSGGEIWLNKMLTPGVPRHLLVNGVDPQKSAEAVQGMGSVPTDRTVVLFVGRLEKIKGCDEFLEAFLLALSQDSEGLHAVIVGAGSRLADLQARVAEANAANAVTMISDVPHAQMADIYRRASIYVSLNRMGNLSNVNLEAMRVGCCMIIPRARIVEGVDIETERLMPLDTAYQISDAGSPANIAAAIIHLHKNPEERIERERATKTAAVAFIPTWEERTNIEIRLLEELALHRSSRPQQNGTPT